MDWIRDCADIVVVAHGVPLPWHKKIAGAVITGSHAMVTDVRPWCETASIG